MSIVRTASIVLGLCDGLKRCADAIEAKRARHALGYLDEKSSGSAMVVVIVVVRGVDKMEAAQQRCGSTVAGS